MKKVLFFVLMLITAELSVAQSVLPSDTSYRKGNESNLNYNTKKLIRSMNENKNPEQIAEDYYNLAMELIKKEEYEKAESYMTKAIQSVKDKKKNNRLSDYYRELAKLQETLKKYKESASNYDMAAELSKDKTQQLVNTNDAGRMRNPQNPEIELQYLNQNALIWTNEGNPKERAQTYSQMAQVNRSMNQNNMAIENYQQALADIDNKSNEAITIKSEMANIHAENNNFDQAISIQKEVVEQSEKTGDVKIQTQQMRQLSDIYFANNAYHEGLKMLQEAYNLAVEKGSVKDAKAGLVSLVNFYEKNKQSQQAIQLYKDFINQLESIIAKDNSLVDIKLFNESEEKISLLEKERNLQNELLNKKSKFNQMLVIFVALLLLSMILLFAAWLTIKKRNKKMALQSLRREMNPHFIFNSLNSVNQFIADNNELEANKYLTSYSKLMRKMMENSNKDFIPLWQEIEQIGKYLELEKMRFPEKFDYKMDIDPDIDADAEKIPNMLIQPNIENAIWHGLRYKQGGGFLKINFLKNGHKIGVLIDDNGIGITESKRLKTAHQKMHDSRGLKNVKERIRLLNDLYKSNITIDIKEKKLPETGVVVKIMW